MKKYLITYNYRPGSIYIHLDGLLFDLKYDPSVIEIPVPRYFKEDDNLKVDLVFHEKVEREGDKKKKGGKAKKKKGKKKKKKGDEEEEPKKVVSMDEKETWINKTLEKRFESTDPVEEIVHDPFTLDMEFKLAIRLIQKNERGRQGRNRYLDALQKINLSIKQDEDRKKLGGGKMAAPSKEEAADSAAEVLQNRIRGILARKEIEGMR